MAMGIMQARNSQVADAETNERTPDRAGLPQTGAQHVLSSWAAPLEEVHQRKP